MEFETPSDSASVNSSSATDSDADSCVSKCSTWVHEKRTAQEKLGVQEGIAAQAGIGIQGRKVHS
jgi:hypothetical protein